MQFDTPAGQNPIDAQAIIGQPHRRVDGALKVTGTAPYAYERHDAVADPAYGWIVGATIARGRVTRIDAAAARAASGVLAVLTTLEHDPAPPGFRTTLHLFGGAEVRHYHQAVALVVAGTFEEARAAAHLLRIDYESEPARCDLAAEAPKAEPIADRDGPDYPVVDRIGDVEAALAAAPVTLDETYTTPDQTHAMMEPHATTAAWRDGKLTIWTSAQVVSWHRNSLAQALGLAKDDLRLDAPFIGGGFGAKLIMRSDALLAALGAKAVGRPCKVALQRPLIANNGTRRAGTIQRIRLGADRDGRLTAIAHHSVNGNLAGAFAEAAVAPTRLIYASPNRDLSMKLATLDLAEGNDMRAPGEAPGLMALEIAMDEMAERLGLDPVAFRILNDTQVDPRKPQRPFSERHLIECLEVGAKNFGWARRNPVPGSASDGRWLVGMGMAAGFRQNLLMPSGARVRLEQDGRLTVETDMTDIGTGSYTILAQTAAEMMGLPLDAVTVRLGDSDYPEAAGSGGQFGANNATSGLYAACTTLRASVAARLGFNAEEVAFANGMVTAGRRSVPLLDAAKDGPLTAEDRITYGELDKEFVQATFGAQFAEVAVNRFTGEMRVRRMLAVIDAGRVLNPLTARSQVIGAMTMGVGSALMEALVVDIRHGFFINHDLGGYEVPVHADIPHLDVVFLDHPDPVSSPMKAKGIGEIGLCGAAAAVANAVYNATGIRVRDYPVTLDKLLDRLPHAA
ncbi:aldehyde oxidoreductase molybdenum-binding subunit PaoC [Methylobacterium nonmethylotrophicum]|uniref:Xanthine dehydrogenase family protein molybdopterin-binding subunit n=1 Tax=Methylobacterium nonmethylotrophicum TaxID=1141884 RepID=A0A4Z0NRW1_9HYPH|nr:aldehyde oxidoreductase molybdenum-binding subunit PaoC [Methylobacterium nonmethylotrophicum]TGD99688.1 xanthine dehydrogenase family protein molybdopterin-binding subunit [Methylobacterium nonmethylotrophicum]